MSKVAEYLQEHLMGEVTVSRDARRHFSHDASILHMVPAIIVYPRTEDDIRKTVRFAWQLAERGRKLPVTARGGGSDTSGAAIGKGVLLVFTAHMNRILALDPRKAVVTVEPGITYDKLEQTLYTHGLFLPPAPSSSAYATIGGGLANNAVGDRTIKYGDTAKYVRGLRVVLANGEVIETERLSKRELNRKMGLSTLEGHIYRSIDALIEENDHLIRGERNKIQVPHDNMGYNLAAVKSKEGFDLTPLFIGSQGTLGIISEATVSAVAHNPETTLAHISLSKLGNLEEVLPRILELKPSMLEMVNKSAIKMVTRINPTQLRDALELPAADIHLFVEFDSPKKGAQKRCAKALAKIIERVDGYFYCTDNPDDQHRIRKVRQSVATILNGDHGPARSVPVTEDVCVPPARLVEFLRALNKIYASTKLEPAAWGHAGSGIVRMHPALDLNQLADRQKFFKLSDGIYNLASSMGGSISASAGDGRVRAPYARGIMGEEVFRVMMQIKNIFDPHGLLNPGVKTASLDDIKAMIRSEYSHSRHEHLPRN